MWRFRHRTPASSASKAAGATSKTVTAPLERVRLYADDDRDLFRDIINVKYEFEQDDWQDLSVESMSFIQSIFTPDPRRRPNVSKLFEHRVNVFMFGASRNLKSFQMVVSV